MISIRTFEQVQTEEIFCPRSGPHFYCPENCDALRRDIFKYKAGDPGEKTRVGYYCGVGGPPTTDEIAVFAADGEPSA